MRLGDAMTVFQDDMRDDEYVRELIKGCLEEEGIDVLLVTLRDIAEARGGIEWLAKETGLQRTRLTRSLSSGARPEFATIQAILKAFHVKLEPAPIYGVREKEAA